MRATGSQSFLNKIGKKYLLLRFIETALMATAFSFLLFAILFSLNYQLEGQITASILGGIFVFILRSYKLGILKFQKSTLASYLSRSYSELEESTDLLLQNDQTLTLLQQIQKQRASQKLEAIQSDIHLPHRMGLATVLLLSGILAAAFVNYFNLTINLSDKEKPTPAQNPAIIGKTENQPTIISKIDIAIAPPAYTATKSFHKNDLNLTLLDGTTVKWSIEFSGHTNSAQLIFSDRDTLQLKNSGVNNYSATRSFSTPGFYRIQWVDQNGQLKSTDYSKIDVIKDQAPKIRIDNLPQFTELAFEEIQNIKFNASLSDDFGIAKAFIIATVSKGSGESVKFREEKLEFDEPQTIHGKQILAGRTLDFHKLGMQPGDELYFYVVATDNKTPIANVGRTETWFIALKDTTNEIGSFDSGMGVDLMPEYFRSQRQIIIDTEKLLAEKVKKQVTNESFKYRSNELGYDQKVLRLRYGQFLGEEFETSITPVESEEELTDMEEVNKKFGHAHDKDNEHNLVKEKTQVKAEAHDEHGDPDNPEKENPMDAIAHKHDTGEESTFFVQSVKTKLKAALTLMWDAELHLRMYDPAKSLPYQYKILKLLKEISNDSRVYVARNGFDPPPLKEEKRLTGDLEELKNTTANYKSGNASRFPAIREALPTVESLLNNDSIRINPSQRELLQRAGNELAGIAMEQPGEYLKTLSLLKSISDNAIDNDHLKQALREVMSAFWNVLPSETPTPARKNQSLHPMDRSFIKQMDSQKHE